LKEPSDSEHEVANQAMRILEDLSPDSFIQSYVDKKNLIPVKMTKLSNQQAEGQLQLKTKNHGQNQVL